MTEESLQQYLHAHIPLSAAMQVSVQHASADEVVLAAPLAPNINHRETLFGGSASAIAILAAWSLLHVRLRMEHLDVRLVIQSNTMHYDMPISGNFIARSLIETPDAWTHFTRMLARKGKARIAVAAVLEYQGVQAGHLQGEFVALGGSDR
ncbi:MAG TPA: YiiD C-terminal domain-containing protein [Oxalicibacterium sp.]|nr:YiiD C-terminal domain-containing protein [Oxalicibacterium sp.]